MQLRRGLPLTREAATYLEWSEERRQAADG
jgi:hypothetical protein